MLFDSHCHLDDPRYDTDRDAVLARAKEAGIDVVQGLAARSSTELCRLLGTGFVTGHTGTNVNDLMVMFAF